MKLNLKNTAFFRFILIIILMCIIVNNAISIQRPLLSGPELVKNTTNFKIHYTLSGIDSTTQIWVDSVAFYVEHCRNILVNLQWKLPPPDGQNGGDSKYDIYIRNT